MRKTGKILLSMLLVLLMCFSMLTVSAENTGVTADGFQYSVNEGKVTITGYTGELAEVAAPEEIGGMTVTAIGEKAFYRKQEITSISLPDTVTSIEKQAFCYCSELKDINLPENIELIGEEAFCGCAVEELHIPNDKITVEVYTLGSAHDRISYGPFANCKNLSTITFDEDVKHIPDNLFAGCESLEKVVIPETVQTIGEGAFEDCRGLKEIVISEGVTEIDVMAFSDCRSLEEVILPKSLKKIGERTFQYSSLKSVSVPASLDEIIQDIFNGTDCGPFIYCESLKSATIDEGTTEIVPYLFAGAYELERVTLPESVTKIGDGVFANCEKLVEISLPDGITEIGGYAFDYTESLKSIELPENLQKLGECAFRASALEAITIPASLKEAEPRDNYYDIETEYGKAHLLYGPFHKCNQLKKASFDEGATEVVANLFAGAFALEEIEFGDNIKKIGEYAFNACTSLKEMVVPESVELIDDRAFQSCVELEKLSFENPDTQLKERAFQECFSLKDVTLPENIKEIPYAGFMECISLETIEFPESVESIASAAFCACSSLDEITLPEKLRIVESSCFASCFSLESITIPENVYQIDYSAFRNCTSLKNVEFTDYSVRYISDGAFNGCSTLDEISLPKGLITIEEEAFENCPSLLKAVVPYSVDRIEENAFDEEIVTIYSKEGSYVHDYAKYYNIKFVNDFIPASTIEYLGEPVVYLNDKETYKPQFKIYPENSTEIIFLTSSSEDVDITGLEVTPWNLEDKATITATLENGNSCSFEIRTRKLEGIELTALPEKTEYILGESLDTTGLKVQALYNNGDKEEVTDYTVEGFSSDKSGEVTVTVKYEDCTAEFKVRIMTSALVGDANLDGKVNIKDATAIQKHIAKIADLGEDNLKVSDVNTDDKVNIKDATEIQKYIANMLEADKTLVGKTIYI